MAIDFNSLVLGPSQAVFGREIEVRLAETRPGDPLYYGTGIYTSRSVDVPFADGTILSDQQTTLDLKVDEWTHLPARGDRVRILDIDTEYWVADQCFDGQGGVRLPLRKTEPPT